MYAAAQKKSEEVAGQVRSTTPGMAFNLGVNQELQTVDTKRPNVKGMEFIDKLMENIAAGTGQPPEVTKQMFTSSYSAARGALEMWKMVVDRERKAFCCQYYTRIYKERMRLKALQGRLKVSKAYVNAIIEEDQETLALYENFRFTGAIIPEVDRLKAAKAARELIAGNLSTRTRETEALGTGDFEKNADRLEKEQNILDEKGLLVEIEEEDVAEPTEGGENAPKNEED
jgi:capsid protein